MKLDGMDKVLLSIAISLFTFTSCQNVKQIDPILKPYYEKCIATFKSNGIKVKNQPTIVKFVERLDGTGIAGLARGMNIDTFCYVWISPTFLEHDYNQRMWIMYHELAHDLFNIEHQESGMMGTRVPSRLYNKQFQEDLDGLIKLIKDEQRKSKFN